MSDWRAFLGDSARLAAEGVQEAGAKLRETATQATKVVGIGVGTIRIVGERRGVCGADYRGAVILEPTEPIEAERLCLEVFATRKRLAVERLAQKTVATDQDVIARNEVDLSGPRIYTAETIRFTIAIPDPDRPIPEVDGVLGQTIRAARAFQSMTELSVQWWLRATLHIPWRRNLRKTAALAVEASGS
jgi:hypothetical protein